MNRLVHSLGLIMLAPWPACYVLGDLLPSGPFCSGSEKALGINALAASAILAGASLYSFINWTTDE